MKLNLTQIIAFLESSPTLAAKLITPASILGLMKLYAQYEQDASDGYISPSEGFDLGTAFLTLLKTAGVTIDDLLAMAPALKALLPTK